MADQDDEQISEAYARLGTALAPPADVAVRVEREVGARRRRRRTAVAGASVLVLGGVGTGAVVLGSGDDADGDHTIATDPGGTGPSGSFTLTRQDGTSVTFDTGLTLSCDKDPLGEKSAPGLVNLWSPFHLDASGEALTEPYFYIAAPVHTLDGQTITLPQQDPGTPADAESPLIVFAAEADGAGKKRANEVSSVEAGAAGTVRIIKASCDPTPVLEVEVDATLGSELEQGTEKLVGHFG